MFPDDATLLARGKYSTLSSLRHEQIKRVQDICRTIQGAVPLILREAEQKPPADEAQVLLVEKCLGNLKDAWDRLKTLSLGLNELESEAWPK